MKLLKNIALGLMMAVSLQASAQTDPVLFTVGQTPVTVSEFSYIYSKANGEKADFSQKSLEEYLDLYVKFKLKVQRARELQLDTVSTLKRELDGYRRQLADSYLMDREVTDRLIREAYERTKSDINISHVLVVLNNKAIPADTLAAYQKITAAFERLKKGDSFETVAKDASEDKNSAINGGVLGWVTALLPDGFYDLETAIYSTAKGKMSGIVRSPIGYHIVRVNDTREARGEIEVAHILLRNDKEKATRNARALADSIYNQLTLGGNFDEFAARFSEDNATKTKNGYLGFFGINKYERAFEDAAFGLAKDGDFSKPIETSAGWHIIKRVQLKRNEPFDIAKNRLKPRIQRDGRYTLAKKSMTERIKRDAGLRENATAFTSVVTAATADTTFLTYKWKAPAEANTAELFNLGGKSYTVADFQSHMFLNSRKRTEGGPKSNINEVVRRMYGEFLDESCLKYEETQLDKKYPDFKSLMREYEEGILLFEATKNLVWDKAAQDSVGIEQFFAGNSAKYQWNERAKVNYYSVLPSMAGQIDEIRKLAAKKSPEELMKKYNTETEDNIAWHDETLEKGNAKALDGIEWKKGSLTANTTERDGSITFGVISEIMPEGPKSLKDARGFVVADYQDYLEIKWIEELRSTYPAVINHDVLKSMVRK